MLPSHSVLGNVHRSSAALKEGRCTHKNFKLCDWSVVMVVWVLRSKLESLGDGRVGTSFQIRRLG